MTGAAITSFAGRYEFLSNFYRHPVVFDEVVYPTNEHAFAAAKTFDEAERSKIRRAGTPYQAKRLGRRRTAADGSPFLRPDWETVKYGVMLGLNREKFSDPDLGDRLLATGGAVLVEGNNHGDRVWGAVDGEGLNLLGVILMQVRGEVAARRC